MGQQSGGGDAAIIASYAAGDANGGEEASDRIGGLVGLQDNGSIIASYATGNANGGEGNDDSAGGLVGWQNAGGSDIASYGFGACPMGKLPTTISGGVARTLPGSTDASVLTTGNTNDPTTAMQWTGDDSPWIFGGGPPRLGYITGATFPDPNVTYTCAPALLPVRGSLRGRIAGAIGRLCNDNKRNTSFQKALPLRGALALCLSSLYRTGGAEASQEGTEGGFCWDQTGLFLHRWRH